MSQQLEIFYEHTYEELKATVNTFINGLNNIHVDSISMSETDYNYKLAMIYTIKDNKDES